MLQIPAKNRAPKRRLFVIAAMIILVAAGGACAYWLWYHKPTTTASQQPENKLPTTEPTKPAQSEGQTFPVPQTTPDTSVQNYTLVTENEEFKIRRDQNNNYLITLYPIVNNSSQYSTYQDQLKTYKQHALDYLKNQNVDVTKVKITYDPAEAANL